MDTIDRDQLEFLVSSEGGPHLSLFLPAISHPLAANEDAIRLSNVCREARQTLTEHWMPAREATEFLKPLEKLQRDRTFPISHRHGVAIYLSDGHFNVFPVSEPVEQRLTIARTFCVRPMLSSVDPFSSFFLLSLSKKGVSLFSVSAQAICEHPQVRLPEGFENSLVDVTVDRGAQAHSSTVGVTGKQGAVFHGQGGMPDTEKSELADYMRRVDGAICTGLPDQSRLLVLAGVDYVTTIYRQISSYARLAGSTISGNVVHLTDDQLFQRAVPIAMAEYAEEREADALRIREQRRDRVATDPEQVLCAAYEGRIDVLFFDDTAALHGSFYPDTRTLQELRHEPTGDPGNPSHDLIEIALAQTLQHGGRVHSVTSDDMPADAILAAALRF